MGVMGPMCHMVRVLLLLAFVQAAVADSILGCGGFVEVIITFPFKIEVLFMNQWSLHCLMLISTFVYPRPFSLYF